MGSSHSNDVKPEGMPEEYFSTENPTTFDAVELLKSQPQTFTQNLGQLENNDIRFYVQDGGLWFTDDGVWFRIEGRGEKEEGSIVIKQTFVGANSVVPYGKTPFNHYSNYFYGNVPSEWVTEVPNYGEIYYEDLYNDIDLRYYSSQNGLKYDFIIHPGADIEQIRLRYEGAEGLELDDKGNLIIKTRVGNLVDSDLFIYQDHECEKASVEGNFEIIHSNEYRFVINGDYQQDEVLVIDPQLNLEYSTFIGGGSTEYGRNIDIDSAGNAYVGGYTSSTEFPTTPGAFDRVLNSTDVFVFKLNPTGSSLIYSTFVGGFDNDYFGGFAVDASGNAYATGNTLSTDFPTTNGSFNESKSPQNDCFVFKLNPTGTALIFSTFIGGIDDEYSIGLEIDSSGNIFVAGRTYSSDFPTTDGAFDRIKATSPDLFVLKLNSSGDKLLYSTFVGGQSSDYIYGMTVDNAGCVFAVGYTYSNDFPLSSNPHDNTRVNAEGYVFKVKSDGTDLLYSTFLGGSSSDYCNVITVDSSGNAYISGYTSSSSDFPITSNAFDKTMNGTYDIFISKMNSTGTGLLYSTFLGGGDFENCYGLAFDSAGQLNLIGYTRSSDFPVTPDAFNDTYESGNDGFYCKFSYDGSKLLYSTFFNGKTDDYPRDFKFDTNDAIYMTGNTNSGNFPTTPGANDTTHNGNHDVFVMKLRFKTDLKVNSASLLLDNNPVTDIYAGLPYTLRVNVTNNLSLSDLNSVRVNLDTAGSDIQLFWAQSTGQFSKLNDPNEYIILEETSKAFNNSLYDWTLDFNITFNWTYPDENSHDISAFASSNKFSPAWWNASNFYSVENDVVFYGMLDVSGQGGRSILDNDIVRGGEQINWTGFTIVYEGTTDVYPPADSVAASVWNEGGNCWIDPTPAAGSNFYITTTAAEVTDLDGDNHTLNVSGIPNDCDKTNTILSIRIDGDNVTYSDPVPGNGSWQRSANVNVGVTITDMGGGYVVGSSVMYKISTDDGMYWSAWEVVSGLESATLIKVMQTRTLIEGKDNLIKWSAVDSLGNGPAESDAYRIMIDTENVSFSEVFPKDSDVSASKDVNVGITISDSTSGVDASSIEYSISYDSGGSWQPWTAVSGYLDGNAVNVNVNISFQDGSANYIKWRAKDVAGNGPAETDPLNIKVDIVLLPRIWLSYPEDGSVISTESVQLSWILENQDLTGVKYDIFLDKNNPPGELIEANYTGMSLEYTELADGETYYWTVVPKKGNDKGICLSGVWSFTVKGNISVPVVTLLSPDNGLVLNNIRPTLSWTYTYDGTETVIFDVYLDELNPPRRIVEGHTSAKFTVEEDLREDVTYYWKIVAKTESVTGPESEIRSFSIDTEYDPEIDYDFTLSPMSIELKPGEQATVQITLTNLGELRDMIYLEYDIPANSGLDVELDGSGLVVVETNSSTTLDVTIFANNNAKSGKVIISFTTTSGKAIDYGSNIEKTIDLTVNVVDDEERAASGKFSDTFLIGIILIVIICIVIISIVLIASKRKKRKEEEKKEEVSAAPSTGTGAEVTQPAAIAAPAKPAAQVSAAPAQADQMAAAAAGTYPQASAAAQMYAADTPRLPEQAAPAAAEPDYYPPSMEEEEVSAFQDQYGQPPSPEDAQVMPPSAPIVTEEEISAPQLPPGEPGTMPEEISDVHLPEEAGAEPEVSEVPPDEKIE
ncbi:MAG: SBBP repeat-containing protein, partial [Thermoplasmata archaeon]